MTPLNIDENENYILQFRAYINATGQVSDESWELAHKLLKPKKAHKGVRLLNYNQEEDAIRFIHKGIVKCECYFNDKNFVADFRVAPAVLCETVSFFNNIPSRTSFETITDCEYLEIPREAYFKLVNDHKDIAHLVTTVLSNHLGMSYYKQGLLRTLDAELRYKHFLEEFPLVAKAAKLEDIASYINVKQPSLSRIRKSMALHKDNNESDALKSELNFLKNTLLHSQEDLIKNNNTPNK